MEVTNCIHCRICKNKEIFLNAVSEIDSVISHLSSEESFSKMFKDSIIFSGRCKDFSESKPTPRITGRMGVIP